MEKIRNRDYKQPKDVYVNDFYSRQLDEIRGLLITQILVVILAILAFICK